MDGVRRQALTPLRALVSASLAVLAVAAGTAAYPHLVAAAVSPLMLTVFRVAIGFCAIAVVALPAAALVRRIVR